MWSGVLTFVVTRAGRLVLQGIAKQKKKDSELRTQQWLTGVSEASGMPEVTVSYCMLLYI